MIHSTCPEQGVALGQAKKPCLEIQQIGGEGVSLCPQLVQSELEDCCLDPGHDTINRDGGVGQLHFGHVLRLLGVEKTSSLVFDPTSLT